MVKKNQRYVGINFVRDGEPMGGIPDIKSYEI